MSHDLGEVGQRQAIGQVQAWASFLRRERPAAPGAGKRTLWGLWRAFFNPLQFTLWQACPTTANTFTPTQLPQGFLHPVCSSPTGSQGGVSLIYELGPRQQQCHPACLVVVPRVPVSAGRRPHPLTPSSWRGRGVAGPQWGRRSGRRGSTGRSQSSSGPTTLQQLPGGGAVTGLGPQGVTWPLRASSS